MTPTDCRMSTVGLIYTATVGLIYTALVLGVPIVNANGFLPFPFLPASNPPKNCRDVQKLGDTESGIYAIHPYRENTRFAIEVYCDMETDGGGWTVIQRRADIEPRLDFTRTWIQYAKGFGNLSEEFWLGLDHIHALTDQTLFEIRFDLADFENNSTWAKYESFYVHDRSNSYKMEVNGYSGNAGDSFSYHGGKQFTAIDKDLDQSSGSNCAVSYKGGWWYGKCHASNLNGKYLSGVHTSYADGIEWYAWKGYHYSLKSTEMKIRPAFS